MVAVTADKVIVELEAKLDRYQADVRRAQQTFERAMGGTRAAMQRTEAQIAASTGRIRTVLLASASAFATAFGIRQIAALADGYTRFTNSLRVAGLEGANLANAQRELFELAQRNGVETETLGQLYGRLTQSSRDLGASQGQLMQFTAGVAAAVRVQGASTEAARGALIQLTQALGGEIVRAEEFNSINEGARPILQAVASNIDKYRGSVSALRRDVVEGKVSSADFFQAFLRGSAQLEQQATRANLTVGQSLIILNNALGRYIGQTDQAYSLTQRFAQAIGYLADNLDSIIPALARIGLLLGGIALGRFAVGMIAAAGATGVASAALFAIRARAIGAATSLEAVGFAGAAAGRGLLGVFGGPVGLAVAALTVGIGLLAMQTDESSDAIDRAVESAGAGAERFRTLYDEARRNREAQIALGDGARRGAGGLDVMTDSAARLERGLRQMGLTAQWATLQAANAAMAKARTRLRTSRERLDAAEEAFRRSPTGGSEASTSQRFAAGAAAANARRDFFEAVNFAHDAAAAGRQAAEEAQEGLRIALNPPSARPPASGGDSNRGRTRRGPDPDDILRRFQSELAQAQQQVVEETANLAGSRRARYEAELAGIEADRQQRARDIEGQEHLSAAQREQLNLLNDQLAQLRRENAAATEADAVREETLRLNTTLLDGEIEIAQATAQLAETTSERRDSAIELLGLSQQRERLEIQAALQARGLNDVERQILQARLDQLDRIRDAQTGVILRENQTPAQEYMRSLNRTPEQMNEDFQRIAIDGLQNLNDGIADAIMGTKSLGEAFKDVANSIIRDLLRIAVQQMLIRPLAEALFGGTGSGGFMSTAGQSLPGIFQAIGGMFGRASGGHVVGGRAYLVGERRPEMFVAPMSGRIVPANGRVAGGQTVLRQTIKVDASGSVNPDGYAEHIVSRVRRETVTLLATGLRQSHATMPARLAEYQRDGR